MDVTFDFNWIEIKVKLFAQLERRVNVCMTEEFLKRSVIRAGFTEKLNLLYNKYQPVHCLK